MQTKENAGRPPASPNKKRAASQQTKQRKATTVYSKQPRETKKPTQDVVYLPAKPLNRNRLLLRLATVAAIVIAIVLAMSVFFKVENIEVAGINKYSAWDISQTSGIRQGDNLMSFGVARAAANIKALPYVKDVRIGIKLPNTVLITVTEVEVTYAIKAQDDAWWLISSDGRVVDKAEEGTQEQHTKILGVRILNPQVGSSAVAQEAKQPTVDENGNTIPLAVTAAQHFAAALDIAEYLEQNGIIGEAASIDVNDLGDIQLWYGNQYQVKLGDTSQLAYKISSMKSAIEQLDSYQSGVLDVRFHEGSDNVEYTPFQ